MAQRQHSLAPQVLIYLLKPSVFLQREQPPLVLSHCIDVMRNCIQQSAHVLYEVGYFLASLISRTMNAVFYAGSMHQTLSARTHIEARDAREDVAAGVINSYNRKWIRRERRINAVFFWQSDHCAKSWGSEVKRARKTLEWNGDL